MLFYKLDEKKMKEITAVDLLERRKASGEEGATV